MLKSGARIGPYEILSQVGAGGMGEVWRARDGRLGRDVAIKVLPAAFASDPDRLKLFEREARATAALNHPYILAIFDVGTHDGQPYLVEELLAGQSLRERLMAGPLSASKSVELAAQLAAGLAAAHGRGIVHRDVKPENVFLTSGGVVKILDFGVAKLARPDSGPVSATKVATATVETQPGTVLGTVGYAAPEQLRGQPVDHRTDVFAFGCVLYEMLSGKRAFHGETQADTISAILSRDPPPLATTGREISPELQGIVTRCLEKSPEDRFQSTKDLAFDLTQLTRRSAVGLGSIAPAAEEAGQVRRRRTLAAALACGAALALGGAFLWGRRTAALPEVKATRLTFRRGLVTAARFAQDGKTVVYSASWDGAPTELFSLHLGAKESTPLGYTKADLLAVSPSGELALLRNPASPVDWAAARFMGYKFTLATAPISGGTPKDLEEGVHKADYAPDGRMAIARSGGGVEYPVGSAPRKFRVVAPFGFGGFRISRDGRSVAFTSETDLSLLGADGQARKLVDLEGSEAAGLAWSPRGDEVWYAAPNELRAVTLAGRRRVVYTHLTDLTLHDVAADGRVLATAMERRSRCFFRGEGEAADRELSWLEWTMTNDFSADGRLVAFHESERTGSKRIVYLRETNGAPPMKLGDGSWPRISPDSRYVVAVTDSKEIVVYPVGAGTVRKVHVGDVDVFMAGLLPDGKSLLFSGYEREKAGKPRGKLRIWLSDLDGSKPRPVSPEGMRGTVPSFTPDGRYAVVRALDRPALYPLAGGEPRPIPGLEDKEVVAGFSADGASFFAFRQFDRPIRVFRIDMRTGRRELVREVLPADRSGTNILSEVVRMSADGRSYVYGFSQVLSDLFLVEGLR
jgi:hypothetical protein